jgi:hypothetical protein
MQIIGTFGRGIGINPDDVKLEDSTKDVVVADTYIYGGTPLTLISVSGVTKLVSYAYLHDVPLTLNVKPYGISKFNKNAHIDETFDALGTYGSGKGTCINLGRVSLMNNVFRTSTGGLTTVFGFDTSITSYAPMDPLYVELDHASAYFGMITKTLVAAGPDNANSNTLLGYVSAYYAHATQPVLEIILA